MGHVLIEYAKKYATNDSLCSYKNALYKIFYQIIKICPKFAQKIQNCKSLDQMSNLMNFVKDNLSPLIEEYDENPNINYETKLGKPFWICQTLLRNDLKNMKLPEIPKCIIEVFNSS